MEQKKLEMERVKYMSLAFYNQWYEFNPIWTNKIWYDRNY